MVILREFPHVIPFAERVAVFQQLIAADKARLDARPVQVGRRGPVALCALPSTRSLTEWALNANATAEPLMHRRTHSLTEERIAERRTPNAWLCRA
jgi:hypothetical protein